MTIKSRNHNYEPLPLNKSVTLFLINTLKLFGRVYMDFIRNEEFKKHHCIGK